MLAARTKNCLIMTVLMDTKRPDGINRKAMVRDSQYLFSLSGCCKQLRGLYILLLFLVFNDYCQTNYFKIYRTDLRQIFRVGRTTAVDDQSEISFSILQRTLPQQPVLVAQPGGLTLGFAVHLVTVTVAYTTLGGKQ